MEPNAIEVVPRYPIAISLKTAQKRSSLRTINEKAPPRSPAVNFGGLTVDLSGTAESTVEMFRSTF